MKIRARLFRLLFGAELKMQTPRPARLKMVDGMGDEEAARCLGGTEGRPEIQAVLHVVRQRMVEASDLATDRPAEQAITPGGQVVAGCTADQRTHDGGGAAYLAQLLAELQRLTAKKEE